MKKKKINDINNIYSRTEICLWIAEMTTLASIIH